MFDETEPGKPRDWCWTIGIIITVCSLNLAVLLCVRILLDAVDEFDEPIVKGEVRESMKQLLTLFSLTFCFGCWCCFCCGGNCFRCTELCDNDKCKCSFAGCWTTLMRKKFIRHRVGATETASRIGMRSDAGKKTNKRAEAGSDQHHNLFELPSIIVTDSSADPEMGNTNDASEDLANGFESSSTSSSEPSLSLSEMANAKRDHCYGRTAVLAEPIRRGSLMPSGTLKEVPAGRKLSQEVRATPRMNADRRQSSVVVRGIDFYQIPIENLTLSPIAIVDRACLDERGAMRGDGDGQKKGGAREFEEISLH